LFLLPLFDFCAVLFAIAAKRPAFAGEGEPMSLEGEAVAAIWAILAFLRAVRSARSY